MKKIMWEVGAGVLLVLLTVSLYLWLPVSKNQVQYGRTVVPVQLLQN